MGQIILTQEEREELTTIPRNISDEDLLTFCAFDEEDILNIRYNHKGISNMIGYAVQLFHLRYLGWSYTKNSNIPAKVIDFIAKQIDPETLHKWHPGTYNHKATIFDHFHEICSSYGYRQLNIADEEMAYRIIESNADVVENRKHIINEIILYLRKKLIVLPKISTIEKWVQEVCNKKERIINKLVYSKLSPKQCESIENAISCTGNSKDIFNLHQLRSVPGEISPDTMCQIINRIEYIDSLGLNVDLSSISQNKRKLITKRIASRKLSSIREGNKEKVFSEVVIYIHETRKMLQDLLVEANDMLLKNYLNKWIKKENKVIVDSWKEVVSNQSDLLRIAEALSFAWHNKKSCYKEFEKRNLSMEYVDDIIRQGRSLISVEDNTDLINRQSKQIHLYALRFMNILKLSTEDESIKHLLKAIDCLKANDSENYPVEHLDKRWRGYVIQNGVINKRYYEMGTMISLKKAIKNNQITIEGSEKYLSFERDLIDKESFNEAIDIYDVLTAYKTFEEYLEDRKKKLNDHLTFLAESINNLNDLWLEGGDLHISPLGPDVPEDAVRLSRRIFKETVPEARLEEILLEVDKWTGFTRHFVHKNLKCQSYRKYEKDKILATIMALGTNVGLTKMSQSMKKYTYDQLYTISRNCIDDEIMGNAQSDIIGLLRSLWVSEYWGNGKTSSSDGRGMRSMVSAFNAEPNPRHGIDKGCTIYRFVCDKYYVYFTKVINTARESQHVIDGVLQHEQLTGTPITEHYTDTGGYSDAIFALAHFLGFAFAPRIKNIADRNLYIFKDSIIAENIKDLNCKFVRTDWIRDYYDEIKRIAYSIKKGHVSGELVMRKLYNKSSHLRRAVVEMGKIEKTIFLLQYYTSKETRRRIQIGLNKGEANNNLAKAVQFGKEGKFTSKDREKQQISASALSLIMDAICLWNAVYMQRSVEYFESTGEKINRSLLKHVSPQNYEHITFLGKYDFSDSLSLGKDEYRKLKTETS